MMQLPVTVSLLLAVLPVYATSVTRLAGETAESFAKRHAPPQTTLAHQVIETSAWGAKSKAIIAFYEQEFEQSSQTYRRIVKNTSGGITVSPALDWLAALVTHLPDKGQQLLRFYGRYSRSTSISLVLGQPGTKFFAMQGDLTCRGCRGAQALQACAR